MAYPRHEWEQYIEIFCELNTYYRSKEFEKFNKLSNSLGPMVRVYYTTTEQWKYDKRYFSPAVLDATLSHICNKN